MKGTKENLRNGRVQRKIYGSKQINVPFSFKSTLSKNSPLNVPLGLKTEGLNKYKEGTYNRNMKVHEIPWNSTTWEGILIFLIRKLREAHFHRIKLIKNAKIKKYS